MYRQFKLLGNLEITEDSVPSRLMQSDKGSALVCYLIVTNEAQPRELLADLLWESTSSSHALKKLRMLLSRIRPFVPELQVTRKTIAFQPTPETTVDLFELNQSVTNGNLFAFLQNVSK